MTSEPERPISADAADRPGERGTTDAAARWENEGGHLPPPRTPSITPSDVSPAARRTTGGHELAAMREKFLADFASGTMGRHHNTYQHRARLLRQLSGVPSH